MEAEEKQDHGNYVCFPANVPVCDLIMSQGHIRYVVETQDVFTNFKPVSQSQL